MCIISAWSSLPVLREDFKAVRLGCLELLLSFESQSLTLLPFVTSPRDIACDSGILQQVWCFGRFILLTMNGYMPCASADQVMLSRSDMAQDTCKYATAEEVV